MVLLSSRLGNCVNGLNVANRQDVWLDALLQLDGKFMPRVFHHLFYGIDDRGTFNKVASCVKSLDYDCKPGIFLSQYHPILLWNFD